MCVCIYIYIYVCVLMCVYVRTLFVCAYVCVCTLFVCAYVCVCTLCVCAYVCVCTLFVCAYVCVCTLFVCACSEINHEVKTDVKETESCGEVARAAAVRILVVWPRVETACVHEFVRNKQ